MQISPFTLEIRNLSLNHLCDLRIGLAHMPAYRTYTSVSHKDIRKIKSFIQFLVEKFLLRIHIQFYPWAVEVRH